MRSHIATPGGPGFVLLSFNERRVLQEDSQGVPVSRFTNFRIATMGCCERGSEGRTSWPEIVRNSGFVPAKHERPPIGTFVFLDDPVKAL